MTLTRMDLFSSLVLFRLRSPQRFRVSPKPIRPIPTSRRNERKIKESPKTGLQPDPNPRIRCSLVSNQRLASPEPASFSVVRKNSLSTKKMCRRGAGSGVLRSSGWKPEHIRTPAPNSLVSLSATMAAGAPCSAGMYVCSTPTRCTSTAIDSVACLRKNCTARYTKDGIFWESSKVTRKLHCDNGRFRETKPPIWTYVRAATTVETIKKVFPAFLPSEVQVLEEPAAREMAYRIQQVPVKTSLSERPILTSCVIAEGGKGESPVLLLHGFDSSLLEWRRLFPLLEADGADTYAVDILGWGFNSAEGVTSFGVDAKREHLYEFWKTHIKKPVVLAGASLGGSIAIDFAVTHPDAVKKLVLIDAQGFAEGVGNMATVPKFLAYAGIAVLKSVPLRSYAFYLAFYKTTINAILDGMRVGRLHCLVPGWADSSVNFMLSGGYNVASKIPEVQQDTLVIWGEEDKILPREYAERFQKELRRSQLEFVKEAGHIPHVEKPTVVADLLLKFISANSDSKML